MTWVLFLSQLACEMPSGMLHQFYSSSLGFGRFAAVVVHDPAHNHLMIARTFFCVENHFH